MKMLDRPNFFLVGAPKCGTTSLYAWLKCHSQVFLPNTKEPHFFSAAREYRVVESLSEYLALYEPCKGGGYVAVGDASTSYLQTPGALEAIRDFDPESKIVIAVRSPIEMTRSLHEYKIVLQTEDVEDFEGAWRLSPERRNGRCMPNRQKVDRFQLVYQDMGLMGREVERAMRLFPADQVHVILFDDLKAEPKSVYCSLLNFLALEDDGRMEFPRLNTTKAGTSMVSRMVTRIPKPVIKAFRRIGISNTGLVDKVVDATTKTVERKPLSDGFRAEMADFYREDVALLGSLVGRDLSGWLG